jgi:hypothetical protein
VTDPLRVYADLYQEALAARQRVDAIKGILARAAEALDKRPERFRFDGLGAIDFPPSISEPFCAAADWPTAPRIQQVLADWHAVATRLNAAWQALWPRDRELLAKASPETAAIPVAPGYADAARAGPPFPRPD